MGWYSVIARCRNDNGEYNPVIESFPFVDKIKVQGKICTGIVKYRVKISEEWDSIYFVKFMEVLRDYLLVVDKKKLFLSGDSEISLMGALEEARSRQSKNSRDFFDLTKLDDNVKKAITSIEEIKRVRSVEPDENETEYLTPVEITEVNKSII